MSHLLHVSRLVSKAMQRKGTVPLMLEYTVPEETAPYLVSSSASVMWINETHPESTLKAAVRETSLGLFFQEIVEAVVSMGQEMQWGNVHPLTPEGLAAAIEHVAFYDLEPLELLIPRAHPVGETIPVDADDEEADAKPKSSPAALMPPELRPLLENAGLPFRPSAWVPDGTIIVVPKDRSYVGVAHQVTPKKIAGVVHNAARGIAVVRRGVPDELAGGPLPELATG